VYFLKRAATLGPIKIDSSYLPNYSKTLITINNTLNKTEHLTFVQETWMKRSQLKKSSAQN